jgi:hypothetical protein
VAVAAGVLESREIRRRAVSPSRTATVAMLWLVSSTAEVAPARARLLDAHALAILPLRTRTRSYRREGASSLSLQRQSTGRPGSGRYNAAMACGSGAPRAGAAPARNAGGGRGVQVGVGSTQV